MNKVSPWIELLIREKSNGRSLRQLGQMFNRSHEKIRQLLGQYGQPESMPLFENQVAAKLGYPVGWLAQLRKQGIISPVMGGRYWLYSEEEVRRIPAILAEVRKCEGCGKPRQPGSIKFCRECRQYRQKHRYKFLSPGQKAQYIERMLAWRKANPQRWKEIQTRANMKRRARRN